MNHNKAAMIGCKHKKQLLLIHKVVIIMHGSAPTASGADGAAACGRSMSEKKSRVARPTVECDHRTIARHR